MYTRIACNLHSKTAFGLFGVSGTVVISSSKTVKDTQITMWDSGGGNHGTSHNDIVSFNIPSGIMAIPLVMIVVVGLGSWVVFGVSLHLTRHSLAYILIRWGPIKFKPRLHMTTGEDSRTFQLVRLCKTRATMNDWLSPKPLSKASLYGWRVREDGVGEGVGEGAVKVCTYKVSFYVITVYPCCYTSFLFVDPFSIYVDLHSLIDHSFFLSHSLRNYRLS